MTINKSSSSDVVTSFLNRRMVVLVIPICLLFALMLRTGTLAYLEDSPEVLFLGDAPLLNNLDGYFYLKNAKDLLTDSYHSVDYKRAYPDGAHLSEKASLLSVIVASLARFSPLTIHWAGTLLPPLLALLLAFPLYMFGMHWGGRLMAMFSVLLALMAYIYATRTSFGMLDTDCLNVTFPFVIAFCFMRFGSESKWVRYLYFIAGILLFLLFLWWWDVAPSVVTAFSIPPLLVALVFFYRPTKQQGILFYSLLGIGVLAFIYGVGIDRFIEHIVKLQQLFLYVTKNKDLLDAFPNPGFSNMEQAGLTLWEISVNTVGNYVFLGGAFVGILLLGYTNFKEFLYLLPLVVVGLLSFTSVRFLIFLSPLLALGFGYLISKIFEKFPYQKIKIWTCVFLAVFIIGNSLADPPLRTSFYHPVTLGGMKNINKLTPKDAVIYAWWDVGHPLLFWSGRATVADGLIHGGERTNYLAIPFATSDFRFSANFITFFSTRGVKGTNRFLLKYNKGQKAGLDFIKTVLSSGPERGDEIIRKSLLIGLQPPEPANDWLDFFYPHDAPPVYFFIESRQLKPEINRWIYWYGTWDTTTRKGDTVLPTILISDIPEYENGKLETPGMSLREETGMLFVKEAYKTPIPVKNIVKFTATGVDILDYTTDTDSRMVAPQFSKNHQFVGVEKQYFSSSGQYSLEILPKPYLSYVQDTKLSRSVVKQLFLYKAPAASPFFKLIDEKPLQYQLWKVISERANPTHVHSSMTPKM